MKRLNLLFLIVCLIVGALNGCGEDDDDNSSNESNGKIRGEYEVINELPEKHSLETVIFEEVINFGCPHCNNFRLLSRDLKEQYKGRLILIDIPVLFRGQSDAPLRLYYVAKSLGKEEEAKDTIFDAKYIEELDVFDPDVIKDIAISMGIGTTYEQKAQSQEIDQAIEAGEQKCVNYAITAVPTIVIAETLKMMPTGSMEAFVGSLPETLDDLLKPIFH